MTLTVGHITFANCIPFFHCLKESGFSGRIVRGVPAELNRLLAEGKIDISPSSSFEYGVHWRDYLLLPGHSISSFGAVGSVLLFTTRPLEELDSDSIALTGESATSVNLLKILFKEFLGLRWSAYRPDVASVEQTIANGGAGLLIGDRALKTALQPPPGVRVYDLGELWQRFTGLPFVFALWIVRRDAARAKADELRGLQQQLTSARNRALANLEEVVSLVPESGWMGEDHLLAYLRAMSFDLTPAHQEGLSLYFNLAVKHGLLPELPELQFFA